MNSLLKDDFVYLEGADGADVLFHIESIKFFRIFSQELIKQFRGFFWENTSNKPVEKKLEEICNENRGGNENCGSCKSTMIQKPKDFVINKLALVLTSKCNLRCKYCYENYGLYDYQEEADISKDTLLKGLQYFTDNFKDITRIQFFGGEPSMCEKQIRKTVDFFETMVDAGKRKQMPQFGIVTNGVYMPDSLIDVFAKYNFHVTVSLDGPEHINNLLRYDVNGVGKHSLIKGNYERLLQKGIKNVGIECTYTAEHIKNKVSLVELVQYFGKEFGCKIPHIVPVNIEKENDLNVMNCLEEYLSYVKEIVDYTFDKMLKDKVMESTTIIAGIISKLIFRRGEQRICPAGVKTFSLSHDSRISPCFMYTSKQDISYGMIGEDPGMILKRAYEFDERINNKQISKDCIECSARSVCSSCLGSFEIDNADVKVSNPIFCETIKFVCNYTLKKLSVLKGDKEQWNQINYFFKEWCK